MSDIDSVGSFQYEGNSMIWQLQIMELVSLKMSFKCIFYAIFLSLFPRGFLSRFFQILRKFWTFSVKFSANADISLPKIICVNELKCYFSFCVDNF